MRNIIAVVVGIAVAVITVMLIQWVSHSVFPPPADLNSEDSEAIAAYMAAAPVPALLIVLFGYMMATFDGMHSYFLYHEPLFMISRHHYHLKSLPEPTHRQHN